LGNFLVDILERREQFCLFRLFSDVILVALGLYLGFHFVFLLKNHGAVEGLWLTINNTVLRELDHAILGISVVITVVEVAHVGKDFLCV